MADDVLLSCLKFVQRGVARREITPGLTHFRICDGRVTGFNGVTTLSAPVDISFNAAPAALPFVRALTACEESVVIVQESIHKVLVRSGRFKTSIACVPLAGVPESKPEGIVYPVQSPLLAAFKTLEPFIGYDASRPWSCGIQLRGGSAFTTNNIVLAEYWLGNEVHTDVNVPSSAIEEIIYLNEEPVAYQTDGGSITFHYSDGRWVKSALLAEPGPDMRAVLDKVWSSAYSLEAKRPEVLDACEKLLRFGDKKLPEVYFRGEDISTSKDGTLDNGALVEIRCPKLGRYNTRFLRDVLNLAELIDMDRHPNPILFQGGLVRGAMLGMSL
jgi:DNA polymerase III sliding clamp (beta) subunit (PCNA family)